MEWFIIRFRIYLIIIQSYKKEELKINITECLSTSDKKVLITLSRNLGISGYSKLRKEDLKSLLIQNIYPDKDLLREKLRSLKDSVLNLIAIYLQNNKENKILEAIMKEEFKKIYKSRTTYYKALKELIESAIVFQYEGKKDEDDVIFIPEEFIPIIKEILTELGQLKVVVKVEGPVEEIELDSMDNLLKTFFTKKSLVNWLVEQKLPKSGTFPKVISRVIKSKQFSYHFLEENLNKTSLKDICVDLELPKSGDKEYLAIKIWNKLMNAKIPKPKKSKVKEIEISEVTTKEEVPTVVGSTVDVKKIDEDKKQPPLVKILIEKIEDLDLDPAIKNAETLETGLYMALKNLDLLKRRKNVEIIRQKDKKKADIVIIEGDIKFGIEAEYVHQAHPLKTLKNIKAKLFDLIDEYEQNVILLVYDSGGKISETELEKFQRSIKLVYKTADDFNE